MLIDHFSSFCPKYILYSDVLKIGMVDHYLVYGIRKVNAWRLKNKKSKNVETRNLRKYNKSLFRNDVEQVDRESILNSGNKCDEMTNKFHETFQSSLDIHAPIKKKRQCSQTAPWMTPLIRELILKRDGRQKRR